MEDYYQDLDRLQIAETDLALLSHMVREQPGILLSDLRLKTEGMNTDAVNIAIARHALYVDLATYRLSEPWRVPVFPDRSTARAMLRIPDQTRDQALPIPRVAAITGTSVLWAGRDFQISDATPTDITLTCERSDPFPLARSAFDVLVQEGKIVLQPPETFSNFTSAGQTLLDQARDVDLATAVFRNRVINPDQYHDDEQAQIAERAATRFSLAWDFPGPRRAGVRRSLDPLRK